MARGPLGAMFIYLRRALFFSVLPEKDLNMGAQLEEIGSW